MPKFRRLTSWRVRQLEIFSQIFPFFSKTTHIFILKLTQIVHIKELNRLVTHMQKCIHALAHTYTHTYIYTRIYKRYAKYFWKLLFKPESVDFKNHEIIFSINNWFILISETPHPVFLLYGANKIIMKMRRARERNEFIINKHLSFGLFDCGWDYIELIIIDLLNNFPICCIK